MTSSILNPAASACDRWCSNVWAASDTRAYRKVRIGYRSRPLGCCPYITLFIRGLQALRTPMSKDLFGPAEVYLYGQCDPKIAADYPGEVYDRSDRVMLEAAWRIGPFDRLFLGGCSSHPYMPGVQPIVG